MTIRRRLFGMSLRSSLLVAFATIAGVWTLLSVNARVALVRDQSVGEISESSQVAEVLSRITARLGEAIEARDAHDAAAMTTLRGDLTKGFAELRSDVSRLVSAVGDQGEIIRKSGDAEKVAAEDAEAATLRRFEADAVYFDQQWASLANVPIDSAQLESLNELDARADAFLHSALEFQRGVTQEMLDELGVASASVSMLSRLGTAFGLGVILFSFLQGMKITRGLATRLERLRDRAGQIGSGDLHARLEVAGNDEIDQVCVAFNAMVADLRSSRNQLEHDALHDTLTGLPNRALFLERVAQRMAEARRQGDYRYAVFFIDLDHFKLVNDSLGHAAGDHLLETVSTRLSALMAELDRENSSRNTVARLGGDEFTILLDRFGNELPEVAVQRAAERVQMALRMPLSVEGHDLTVTASIGVIMGAATYEDAASLLRDADAALYKAKEGGRARHALFDNGMHESAMTRLRLENDLRRALERHELILHYQPVTDLSSGDLLGFEALLRWMRDGKIVGPNDFIPIAEQTGQIVPIGEWVVERACEQLREWRASSGKPCTMSVNVSPKQLGDANLIPHLRRVLEQTGLDPSALIIEITESMLVERGAPVAAIAQIRALGVRVYIDDFGTGHSTLSGLNRYPVDGLKVDRSFVESSEGKRDQMAVLHAVVKLAHDLDMPVVAEGVETVEQLAMLQGLGCDRAQGFLFSKPVVAVQAKALIEQQPGNAKKVA